MGEHTDVIAPSGDAPTEAQLNTTNPDKLRKGNILQQIEWIPTVWIFLSLSLSLIGLFICEFHWKTLVTAFIFYYIGGVGITAGYHRLWSHRSYDAALPVKLVLLFMGTGAFEGSVFNWCLDHRAHHRYTDTPKDPYNISKGFFYAHMGWLLWKRDDYTEDEIGPNHLHGIDISDLRKDPILRIQHKYYGIWAFLIGIALPTVISGVFWGDWLGGFFFGAMAKSVFLQHCTFFINSLAHTWGDATYSDQKSPRDSYIVSLFTFGEGYHNFHHEFPYDYRNGLNWFHYDPGKWVIRSLNMFGLTWNLKRFPSDLFHKGKITMLQKQIDEMKAKWIWGSTVESLPTMTMQQYKSRVSEGASLILIEDVVHDITKFADNHPGGKSILAKYVGLDATNAFNGKVYNHSLAARNLLATLRMAKLISDDKKNC